MAFLAISSSPVSLTSVSIRSTSTRRVTSGGCAASVPGGVGAGSARPSRTRSIAAAIDMASPARRLLCSRPSRSVASNDRPWWRSTFAATRPADSSRPAAPSVAVSARSSFCASRSCRATADSPALAGGAARESRCGGIGELSAAPRFEKRRTRSSALASASAGISPVICIWSIQALTWSRHARQSIDQKRRHRSTARPRRPQDRLPRRARRAPWRRNRRCRRRP